MTEIEKLKITVFWNDPSTIIGPLKHQYPNPGWFVDEVVYENCEEPIKDLHHMTKQDEMQRLVAQAGWSLFDETHVPARSGSEEYVKRIYTRVRE